MNKKTVKKGVALLIVFALIMGCFSIISFAQTNDKLISPVFSDTPQYIYEISKPNNGIEVYHHEFNPILSENEPSDNAPVISGITDTAAPGESIVIDGSGFSDADVLVCGIGYSGKSVTSNAEIITQSDTSVTAIIPDDLPFGMYLVYVKNKYGISYPVRVNVAMADWLSDTVVEPGETISVYGKNLSDKKENAGAYVYITNNSYYEKVIVPSSVNPYKVSFDLPNDIPDGEYKLWLHNGYGAKYGWSNALTVSVENETNKLWTGKTITVDKTAKTVSIDSGEFGIGSKTNRLTINGKDLKINNSDTQTKVTTVNSVNYLKYDSVAQTGIPITISGSSITVDGDDQALLDVANCIAQNRDTVYLKNGDYKLTSNIKVVQAVRFMGESKENTIIRASFGNNVTTQTVQDNYLFTILTFPSEFNSITFYDDVNSILSPTFIYANAYTTDGTSSWVRDGFATEYFKISNVNFQKFKTYTSKDATGTYNYEGFQNDVTIDNGDGTQKTFSAGIDLIRNCITVSSVSDCSISNCNFTAPRGIDMGSVSGITVENNTAYGTWVMDGESGPCFVQFNSCDNIDINNNKIMAYEKYLYPDKAIQDGDRVFDRVFVFQNHKGDLENIYIGENDLKSCGTLSDNSGEQIMFEGAGIVFEGNPESATSNTMSFSNVSWTVNDTNNQVYTNETNRKIPIVGTHILVSNGKGISQYRTVTAAQLIDGVFVLTLDKAWDIIPTSESRVDILIPFCDVVIYKNSIDCLENYYETYNATAGIQAYGSMYNVTIDNNTIKNVSSGIIITARYSYPERYTTDGIISYYEADCALFGKTLVENNTVENTHVGITQRLVWNVERTDAKRFSDVGREHSVVERNTIIRNNKISNVKYSNEEKLTGVDGDGISVGQKRVSYTNWGEDILTANTFINNSVIENNVIKDCANAGFRISYAQDGTILRNNTYSGETQRIMYEQSVTENSPTVNRCIEYVGTPTDSYGTAADGITKTAGNELNSIYVNLSEITTDFSEGLRYWGASESRTGTASQYASVEDGVVTVKYHANAPAKYDGIQTVRINIPEEAKGKKIGFVCDVQRTALLNVILSTNSKRISYDFGNSSTTQALYDWYTVYKELEPNETDTYMYMKMQLGDRDPAENLDGEFRVRNLRIGYINDEGIFTQINGELVNTKYNTPYYGTEEKGIYTKDNKGAAGQNLVPFETLKNDNFSEGLKYWSSYDKSDSFASDVAKVENGELVITAATDANSFYCVMSTGVKIPQGLTGKMLGVAFRVHSPNNNYSVGFKTDVAGHSKDNGSVFGFTNTSSRVSAYGASRGYTIQENDKVVYIYFKQFNNNDNMRGGVTTIDDVVLFYYDNATPDEWYSFDGQPITSKDVYYYTYGTEEKGIYVGNQSGSDTFAPVKNIAALDEITNFDFSQGLKYWGTTDRNNAYASDFASVENGQLKLVDRADQGFPKMRSVSVKLPNVAKDKKVVVSYDLTSNEQFDVKVHTYSASSGWKDSGWYIKSSTGDKSVRVTTKAYAIAADAQTISIEMQLNGKTNNPIHYALVDNITIQIVDEGGMDGKYAELNGAPIGYEYGDANADEKIDILDLVRLKKYFASEGTEVIYLAAANADKDVEMSITDDDLVALRKILLAVE